MKDERNYWLELIWLFNSVSSVNIGNINQLSLVRNIAFHYYRTAIFLKKNPK